MQRSKRPHQVPAGARAGDHLAGIVAYGARSAAVRAGRSRFKLRFVPRLAVAVQVRLPGRLTSSLELRGAGIKVSPAGASLALRLASTGTALVARTRGTVRVLQDGRQLFRRRLQIEPFVPGTEIEYLLPWRGKPVQGDYEVRGTLLPEGGKPVKIDRKIEFGKDRIREYRKETGRQAVASTGVSPAFLAISAPLAGALALLGTAYVRLRRGA